MGIKVDVSKPNYVDKDAIKATDVFIVVMSESWVKDPLRIEELEYAKSLHKPIAALVLDGFNASSYLRDADVLIQRECPSVRSEQCIHEIIEVVKTELTRRENLGK